MRLKFLLPLVLFCAVWLGPQKSLFASHSVGGDITYRCLGQDANGNSVFRITLTIFQDCLNGQQSAMDADDPARYAIYTNGANPVFVTAAAVPSDSASIVDPDFSNDCISNYPNTCLRMVRFHFNEALPPSPDGYVIIYQRCCRNATIANVINPANTGVTYSAIIPPFEAGECPNNSAVFNHLPPQIICANNPFSFDASATDPDADSLSYKLCTAYTGASTFNSLPQGTQITPPPFVPLPYLPPYTPTEPAPGLPPISIDPVTGIMSGIPNQIGRFIFTVCVDEWRNGEVINTLSRDMQFVITDCSKNVIADIPLMQDIPPTVHNNNIYEIHCKDLTVHFTNTSQGGNTYLWDFGVPGATSTAFEPTFTYPDTGRYVVKLIVNPGTTCSDSITREVWVYPFFHVGFTYSGKLCPGEQIQFHDTSNSTLPPIISWKWDFGDGTTSTLQNPNHVFDAPGGPHTIVLKSETAIGCRDSAKVELPIDYIDVFAGNDTTIAISFPFSLHGTGADFYQWSPADFLSNPNIADPAVHFPSPGKYAYRLDGSTEHGCFADDSIHITVVKDAQLFVPSGFTPNGDGLNDEFSPSIVGYTMIHSFKVFNRYGQLVYVSYNNNNPGWDGKMRGKVCDMGTYFWVVKATRADGVVSEVKGTVDLIR